MVFSLEHFLLNVLYRMCYCTTMVSKTCFTILPFAILAKDLHEFVPVNFTDFTNSF